MQFPLETVIQLLKEAGVDLPADISGIVSSKPSEAAAPDADNQDLVNMPATFDFEGDETLCRQGPPPGEVRMQLGELQFSESDSDSSAASILGVCLHGFDGDAWMSDAEGAHNDIQAGEAVNDPGDILRHTTGWRARVEDVGPVQVHTRAGEGCKQPCSGLTAKTVTLDLHGTVPSANDGVDGKVQGRVEKGVVNTVTWGFNSPENKRSSETRQRQKVQVLKRMVGRRETLINKSDTRVS